MKSSFKKKEKVTGALRGVFGHPDLDIILERSAGKGQLLVLEEDHPSTHYLSLLRYFLSSNYQEGIASVVFDVNPARWGRLISPPLAKGTAPRPAKSQIAWRYNSMEMKSSHLDHVGHFDLSKSLPDIDPNLLLSHKLTPCPLSLYKEVEQALLNAQTSQDDTTMKKLLLASLPSSLYEDKQFSSFLQALRCLTRSSHVLTLVSVPNIIDGGIRNKLLRYADCYLKMETVSKNYPEFSGCLHVLKEYTCCSIRTVFRGPSLWGCKLSSRHLKIESLYEQPFSEQVGEELM